MLTLFGSVLSSRSIAAGDLQQRSGQRVLSIYRNTRQSHDEDRAAAGEVVRKHLSKDFSCGNTIEVFSKWVGFFWSSLTLNQREGKY